jgi:glutamate dehydrogenase (NAD(P)+)
MACRQFARAADVLGVDDEVRTRLLEPRRSLVCNFPVRMDSGEVVNHTGYRVQHTLTMGPTKGGARDVDDLEVLARRVAVRRRQGRRALRPLRALGR